VAIGEAGATNAGILAAQILALGDAELSGRLKAFREAQTEAVHETVED
jgi:5-(carboxyamino)imidazole ribonucleotide mutase